MRYIDQFIALVREQLGPERLSLTGGTLYSAADTLTKGDVYLLGTNPGGGYDGKSTLDELLRQLPSNSVNEYFGEEWDRQSRRLQMTLRAILHLASSHPESVCASNLIFVRSPTQDQLKENFWKLADRCWPAHEFILDVVQPKLVIAYGNGPESAYAYLYHKLQRRSVDDPMPAGHGKTQCRTFIAERNGRVLRVLGLPHPSRFILRTGDTGDRPESLRPSVAQWLRSQLADAQALAR